MSRDALIVGISTYEILKSLTTPADDAEAVAQLLAQYGDFNVTRLPGVVDKAAGLLRVGRKTTVTQRQLKEALVQLFKPEGKHFPDTALFYFSGHGTRDSLGISQGFLATSETHPNLDHWGLPLKWLRELLQESPVKQQIIWLDCCYSGELLNFDEADPLDQGEARDRCFIAASRDFEVAYEGIARPYSVLTEALLHALDPTHHPEGLITNLTLVDLLNRALQKTIQRPLHTNVGSPILLTHRSRHPSVAPARTASDVCPYKGLLHFECNEVDPLYFFGREELTDQLLAKVREHHFVAVLGVSGSGKSSVVQAGLLYQLQQGQKLSGSERWPQLLFRPGEHPLQSLALAFVEPHLSVVERAQQAQQAEELLARGAHGFQHLVRAKAGQERLVLVIDQFEEVFTLCQQEAERQAFLACLLEGLPALSKQLCLILTMRADFFGKCAEQNYAGLSKLIQDHLLTVQSMEDKALRRVIACPAQSVQLEVEPELVDAIIEDLTASPGRLPLLEYTLWALWQGRQENRLSLAHYVRLGGINGALQQRADEVYASLTEEEKATAKAIFLELTQLGEGTEDTRKQMLKQDLITPYQPEALVEQTLQKLAAARLVVMDSLQSRSEQKEQSVVVVDVAHETLIRHWSVLRAWIKENRELKTWRDKLRQAEREWQEKQQDEELLLRGSKLLEAQEREKGYRAWLTAREVAFIAASGALKKREQEEKKRVQQEREAARQRELEQAKQLAEEQAKLVKEQEIRAKERELASQERLEAQQRELEQAKQLAIEQEKLAKEQEIRAKEREEAQQKEIAQANQLAEEQAKRAKERELASQERLEAQQRELEQANRLAIEQEKLAKEQEIRAKEREEAQQKEIAQATKLAEEQARHIEEQQKAAKRLRRRLVMTVGGLMVAGVAAAVAIFFGMYAEQQKKIATQQKEIALRAIGAVTYDVIDRLEGVPRATPVLTKLLDANIKLLDDISALDPSSWETQREKSSNLNRVGHSWLILGDVSKAFTAYQQALEISQRLAQADPSNTLVQQGMSYSYKGLGDVLRFQLDAQAALIVYQQALEIDQRLAQADPGNTLMQQNMSFTYERLSYVQLYLSATQAALTASQQALEIRKRLAQADPSNTQAQRDVSSSYQGLGDVQFHLGATQAALTAYQQALEIRKRFVQADPSNTRAQREVSASYDGLGDVQFRLGKTQAALTAYQQALEIRQRLAQADPSNTLVQREVSVSYDRLGYVQLQLGKTQAALTAYQQALETSQRLAQADPSNFQAQRDVSVSYSKLGDVQRQLGKTQAALTAYQHALEISQHLAQADPSNAQMKLVIASTLFGKGTALYKQCQYEKAATTFAQGLQYVPEHLALLGNDTELALVQNDLPRFQERLAKLLPRVEEDKNLVVILPFFSWLADPKREGKEVLAAIEQHLDLTVEWDFSDLEPVIQRQGFLPLFFWSTAPKQPERQGSLPLFFWSAAPKQPERTEVLTAVEQHPDLIMREDFSLLEPRVPGQTFIDRQAMARDFIRFFNKEIDVLELKMRLEGGEYEVTKN